MAMSHELAQELYRGVHTVDGVRKIFVHLPNWSTPYKWWIWNVARGRLHNFNHGGFEFEESANYWQTREEHPELHSWHDLYVKFNVNPLAATVTDLDVWISPDGEYWVGTAHMVAARKIRCVCYGVEDVDDFDDFSELELIKLGWIKATRSAMWPYYVRDNARIPLHTTKKAYDALFQYCVTNNLEVPLNVKFMD